MTMESVNDAMIAELLTRRKQVTNPNVREADKASHIQKNFRVVSSDGYEFNLYWRQNKRVKDDFSCGLAWHMPSGETMTLVRYNGSSHPHQNRIKGTVIEFRCHIHRATERYIRANLKPEGFAEPTDRYRSISGAFHDLVSDCNITGITTERDYPDLFE
ncbi:hypothetical protein ACJU26_05720 [Acidithiobacillus sp. M4-SHS-6]|uniref:hypothetical protein n=1 Tax=Acidithiobacillus sp. M4-SHS-6 TaxID=3383024 RepID=UPI0039BDF5CE